MKQLFRRSTPSRQVGLLLASDRIMLASLGNPPIFATRAINGPQEWPQAMAELFKPIGVGDLLSATMLANLLAGFTPVAAFERTNASVDAVLAQTWLAGAYELQPGQKLSDVAIDKVFIGSCTNSRIEDLRAAAAIARGRKVAAGVQALVVPGSEQVKAQAEAEGLDKIFIEAGFEWRLPGCSMCLAMNNDRLQPGERCASTSNRNFEGRQGRAGRTHLVSPAMAAAAAVTGRFADIRAL